MLNKLLTLTAAVLLLSLNVITARAQGRASGNETPRYEIGGQIFAFQGRGLGYGFGAGGRFTYNVNEYVALDNEVDFFLPDEGPPYATEGLFGVKVGKRIGKVGVFAKARPGFQTGLYLNGRDRATFVMDVGGVVEYYPTRSFVIRFDVGDVIIPLHNNTLGYGSFNQRPGTTHNLQTSLGVGIRW